MSKPAARMGDPTVHGGTIVAGFPMVLIGGQPAARIGDMHVCPMVNPGTPPPPHVGGPIALGSATVLIGGMPAARMGDMATCAGPPDSIAMGCPTVLIGDGGGSGGGGGGGAAKAASDAGHAALVGAPGPEVVGPHWIEYQFVDSAGNPITGKKYQFTHVDGHNEKGLLTGDGVVRRGGLPEEGECNIIIFDVCNAKWSVAEARAGETVQISTEVAGYEDGTPAKITIMEQDIDGADDWVMDIETQVSGGRVEGEWTFEIIDDSDDVQDKSGYSSPEYYFTVEVVDCKARSGLLIYQDWIEITVNSSNPSELAGKEYILKLANGEVRKGTLDSSGKAREEKVPPVSCELIIPGLDGFIQGES